MSSLEFEILATAMTVSAACAVPGAYLVLRQMSMVADAISHTVLLGIVLAFLVVPLYGHPLMVFGASVMGVVTVLGIDLLKRTGLVREDAAIGITFPALFSLGVLLISLLARDAHLDEHMVFQGDLVYSVFQRLELAGRGYGPMTLWKMAGIFLLNGALALRFHRELKIATFDPVLAATLGISPSLVHLGLVLMTSVTAVGAFDSVGSILVIGFMVVPSVTARLLTDSLARYLGLSVLLGCASSLGGFWIARTVNGSVGGSISLVMGAMFVAVLLASPRRGLVADWRRRRRQRVEFAVRMLVIHLFQHRTLGKRTAENHAGHLEAHLGWSAEFSRRITELAEARGLIRRVDTHWLGLTSVGERQAEQALAG